MLLRCRFLLTGIGNRLVDEKIAEIKSFLDQFKGNNGREKVEWILRDEFLAELLPDNYKKRKAYELERILGYAKREIRCKYNGE